MHVAKPTKIVFAVVAVLLLLGAAAVVMLARRGSHGPATRESTTHESNRSSARPPEAIASSGTSPADARTAVARPDARAAERAAMLEAIAKARRYRVAVPAVVPHAASATAGNAASTTLDIGDNTGDTSDWEKRALGTLNSLLGQCYDLGRAEDPAFAGTIEVQFKLVGEPKVGALLEDVQIVDEDTSITQPTFRDCVTQQLYALELDPPPDGVTIERQLTLRF
jgi:hypothetical protein